MRESGMTTLRDRNFVLEEMRRVEEIRTRETPLVFMAPAPPPPNKVSPRERMSYILFRSATDPVELILGLSGVLWAIWFIYPLGGDITFTHPQNALLPHWGWGILFFITSVTQVYSLLHKRDTLRRVVAMTMFLLWTFALLAAFFEIGIFVPTSLLFALAAAWIYLRQSIPR